MFTPGWSSVELLRYHAGMPLPDLTSHESSASEDLKSLGAAVASSTRVLRQFRIVFNAVRSHFRNVEKAAGIGGAQVWALSVIDGSRGIGINELARSLDVHQSTASNLVKGLVAQGLVEQKKSDIDRRAVVLMLSASGKAVLHKAPMPFAGVLPDALASMDEETLARLEADLASLIFALEAGNAGANTPLADI